ncbi:OmpA family protein [Paracoccus sp. S-4012]|nr:OmpA family protein [Paracoccus sp. S-4012]
MAGDTVTFPADQVVLTAEAQLIVARQAEWLTRHRDFRAVIEGHADEQGTREHNLALGARRAASVQQHLVARGIDPGRISTVSYGNERPLEACTDEACFERNRRAVTVVSPAGAGV